jgi:DNA polymerase-3 subunit gamma/tau
MTWYLKYRPQTIAELDLSSVRESLGKVLVSGNIPHAWLFSGPRGTGKTSSARILAKAINCESGSRAKNKSAEPCNECPTCVAITSGSAPDVVEIDAASNRGIDEIRDLREKVRFAPMQAKNKVYIIDEVHMLTAEAANALLKTLEEPPEHVFFVLCTTEPEKLPETVISRCTRISFRKPSMEEAVISLKRVVSGEKLKADNKVLELIALAAKGSFRDGTKLLEQVVVNKGEISDKTVREVLGTLEFSDPEEFLKLMETSEYGRALDFLAGLSKQGVALRGWAERYAEVLRGELLAEFEKGKDRKRQEWLLRMIEKLETAYERMRGSAVPELPLEVMVIEEGLGREAKPEKKVQVEDQPEKPLVKTEVKIQPETEKMPSGEGRFSLADMEGRWVEIMKAVKPKNHSVEALLRSTRPMGFDGEKLTLEVFYKFHKDRLESDRCRQIVEEAVGQVFGMAPVKLYLQLGQKAAQVKEDNTEELVKAAEEIFK